MTISHQWMFIVDTVDAAYPPENWTPQAVMDRLGEIVNQRPDLVNSHPHASNTKNGGPRVVDHSRRMNNQDYNEGNGDSLSSLPITAMAQRESFSGETLPNSINSLTATGADYQSYQEALSQAGIPSTTSINLLRKSNIKPLLSNIRQSKITSLASLEPFFSRASLANYEAVYSLGNVDWDAVERSLEADLFEGGGEE